jgi:soluble lytic murein transglycosylase-like protein
VRASKCRPKVSRVCAAAAAALAASVWPMAPAMAESSYHTSQAYKPATVECVMSASRLQGVPVPIIFGFLKTEGGHLGQESRNTDGSYDLGPMQINDRAWLQTIAKMHFAGDAAAARNFVRDDGCYNIHIGTWIFKQALVEAGGDYRAAVGYYNSHNPAYAERYRRRYAESLEQVLGVMNQSRKQ